MKILESTHTIRFPDCDPFNHLNNAHYIDYFINAREDHEIKNYAFNAYTHAGKTGKCWVVGQNQIAYFSPALLMEKVIIQSLILEWHTSDILIEMRMWNFKKTKLKSLLWTRFTYYDLKKMCRVDHETELVNTFKENICQEKISDVFEKRVKGMKEKKFDEL